MIVIFPVVGHAELEESDPAAGATITTPYTLTARFSEEIGTDRSQIVISNSADEEVASGGISEDDATVMTVELPALEPGEYTASWTAVTPDDNGVERGTFTFTVEASPTPAPTPTVAPTEQPGSTATPQPPATAAPAPTPAPTQVLTPTPSGQPGNISAGAGTDVLLALAAGIAIVGVLAFLLVRRSRQA
jgi:methionine-rich copper-binding protein CopC